MSDGRMRKNAKANAITNSPFVRALINPVIVNVHALAGTSSAAVLPVAAASTSTQAKDATQQPKERMLLSQPRPPGSELFDKNGNVLPVAAPVVPAAATAVKRKLDQVEGSAAAAAGGSQQQTRKKEKVETRFTATTLPPELKKYWFQRHKLFSLFDEGIEMDKEGWYSATPENIAIQIAERCRCELIVDAFCGVGGNAIQFAQTCERVIAIDNDPIRLSCARKNAEIYGVADRIEFILGDFVEWAEAHVAAQKAAAAVTKEEGKEEQGESKVEVVFMSPPWGGIDYLTATPSATTGTAAAAAPPEYSLNALAPLPGAELFSLARQITPNIAFFLPRNTSLAELSLLVAAEEKGETVEVEEEWTGTKLKAVTAYFGELVQENCDKKEE